jgi:hypothetical protein
MRPEQGVPGKTRVVKVIDQGERRRGLVVDTDFLSGTWMVLFDDTKIVEGADPDDFVYEKAADRQAPE